MKLKIKLLPVNRLLIVVGIVMICLAAIFGIWLKVNVGLMVSEIDVLNKTKNALQQDVQSLNAHCFSLADDKKIVEKARELGLKPAQTETLD